MTQQARPLPPVFHIDVSAGPAPAPTQANLGMEMALLLRQMVMAQERTNQLLEEVVSQMHTAQKQRATELGNWKEANPELAESCRTAAETLTQAQTQYLRNITDEVHEQGENLADSEFMLNEFVDRFGPRLAHLNGVLHLLAQLGSVPSPANAPQQQ